MAYSQMASVKVISSDKSPAGKIGDMVSLWCLIQKPYIIPRPSTADGLTN